MAEFQLTKEIIGRAVSFIWDEARLEWELNEVYEADDPETCLCGHFPIIECCVLVNKRNRNSATVGNCCVKKFIGLPSNKIFQAVKRVRRDQEKSLNGEAVDHAYLSGWINDWEKTFYFDIMRKRELTEKQRAKKLQVNQKVLNNMRRRSEA